jgi:hypothetical protein
LLTGSWRDAHCGDRSQKIFDLSGCHLASSPVAESSHDEAAGSAGAAAVGSPGLGEEQAVIAERRGLGALDVLKPLQVLGAGPRVAHTRRPLEDSNLAGCKANTRRLHAKDHNRHRGTRRLPVL